MCLLASVSAFNIPLHQIPTSGEQKRFFHKVSNNTGDLTVDIESDLFDYRGKQEQRIGRQINTTTMEPMWEQNNHIAHQVKYER